MDLLPDQIEKALQEGQIENAKLVNNNLNAITREINRALTENKKATTATYTVTTTITMKIDTAAREIDVTGSCSAPRGNITEKTAKIKVGIEDPNQPGLVDGTTPNPADEKADPEDPQTTDTEDENGDE